MPIAIIVHVTPAIQNTKNYHVAHDLGNHDGPI